MWTVSSTALSGISHLFGFLEYKWAIVAWYDQTRIHFVSIIPAKTDLGTIGGRSQAIEMELSF